MINSIGTENIVHTITTNPFHTKTYPTTHQTLFSSKLYKPLIDTMLLNNQLTRFDKKPAKTQTRLAYPMRHQSQPVDTAYSLVHLHHTKFLPIQPPILRLSPTIKKLNHVHNTNSHCLKLLKLTLKRYCDRNKEKRRQPRCLVPTRTCIIRPKTL